MTSPPDARVYPRVLCLAPPAYGSSPGAAGAALPAALDALARALDSQGIRQVIVAERPAGKPALERVGSAATVRRLGVPLGTGQVFAVAAAATLPAMGRTADILHLYHRAGVATLPLALATATAWDIPLVVTLEQSHLEPHDDAGRGLARLRTRLGRPLERLTLARAAAVIVPERAAAEVLAAHGVSAGRIHVIAPDTPGDVAARQVLDIYRAVWARQLARRVAIWHPTTS
ncbi:MAG TPA: glycosyltransferase family 4 protein [Longimicrobiales bacterium]